MECVDVKRIFHIIHGRITGGGIQSHLEHYRKIHASTSPDLCVQFNLY